ncbi:hypothetical protein [Lactiplantibacillus plantarum]|uniref:hypothetical protein n=1 Tax=Lactiplantibacillus plantarum TaxID=1590 RepID=UPI000930BA76|nr:hypothetical protein [Lactiplantibacillus plantarum]QHM44887.1 hypothetical protein C7M38_03057 [Lactiplantibacillus plantarum]
MSNSLFTLRLAGMLLRPTNSEIIGRLYEKAPNKKVPSILKKIPDRLKIKIIENLLDSKNRDYTISKIKEGKLDYFYHVNVLGNEVQNKNYSELLTLVKEHNRTAGSILLTLVKYKEGKDIESYFNNEISKVNVLQKDWQKIDWTISDENTEAESTLAEEQLKRDYATLAKANEKLKAKLEQTILEKTRSYQKYRNEIKQNNEKFREQVAHQIEIDSKEKERLLELEKAKYISEKKDLIDENEQRINDMNERLIQLDQQLNQKSEKIKNYYSIFKLISDKYVKNLTVVAYDQYDMSTNEDYLYVGVLKSMDQMFDMIKLLKPEKFILIQEITSKALWMSLMTKLHQEKYSTQIVMMSKYELVSGGKRND